MRLSGDDVLRLARTYCECLGVSLTTAGVRAAGNDKIFVRLASGRTCTVRTLERAGAWFAESWPDGLPWPADIPHPRRPCCGATPIPAPANCDDAAKRSGVRRSPPSGRG
jgi:hypothetical protein